MRMAAHEVPIVHDPRRDGGLGLHPAALDEERGRDGQPVQPIQDRGRDAGLGGTVGMLGVERERDTERRGRAHFSTPVMTTPRMNTRWKIRNRITGMSIVISVPACT